MAWRCEECDCRNSEYMAECMECGTLNFDIAVQVNLDLAVRDIRRHITEIENKLDIFIGDVKEEILKQE